ncbi:type A2 lantipeptide [Streptomyces yatensis]|uniref:Type A2 lantipeptide n=1 Tax=Streptomyces yatensis TaxID=155177 RepID=A0ABN2HQ88_9ACTN|nr:type A2 lantipeptide [Streptomyces yatensis]
MNNAPKVATQEISDAELDNVAGGIASPVGDVLGTVAGPVAGALGTVTGTVDGLTGLNTTGIVGGVVGTL